MNLKYKKNGIHNEFMRCKVSIFIVVVSEWIYRLTDVIDELVVVCIYEHFNYELNVFKKKLQTLVHSRRGWDMKV